MITGNRLLDGLSERTRERLQPYLQLTHLRAGRVLEEPGEPVRYLYFPSAGLLSCVGVTLRGETLEVAVIGNDGCSAISLAAPHRLVVPLASAAYRVSADVVGREIQRSDDVRLSLSDWSSNVIAQCTQSAICVAFHPLVQRLSRWLLTARDQARSNTLELTQEFVAQMLGVSRPKVSQALMVLETRALIHQGLGRIHLIDRPGLQTLACECYEVHRRQRSGSPTGAPMPLPG